jgi:hypothetical protein
MSDPVFERMRAGLVARGLLTSGGVITPAGHAHVDALLVELGSAEAGNRRFGPRVKWRRANDRVRSVAR